MRRAVGSVVVAGLVLVATGCGARVEILGVRFGEECPVVPVPLSSRTVAADDANVQVIVSNQSFENPDVRMSVVLDGEVLADQVFDVCGQHSRAVFSLDLEPGWHDLDVTTDSGLAHRGRVDVPRSGPRWVLVSHRTEDAPHLDVDVVGEQPGFG